MMTVQNRQDEGFDPTPRGEHMLRVGWDEAVDHRGDLKPP